jgi:hypothetical protein
MSDVVTQLFPWKYLIIASYKAGHLPLWNMYTFSGNPLTGNYQSASFSPLNLLFFILPFIDSWSLLILFQPLIAGLGMYLFLSQITRNKWAGLLSGVTFMFCGFMTVWMEYGTLALAAGTLPWILLSLGNLSEKRRLIWTIIGSFALATSFLAGHFQTSLYVLLFSVIYTAVFSKKDKKTMVSVCTLFGVGLFLSLVQILPTVFAFGQSVISNDVFTDAGIPWWYLVTAFIPDFFGNPTKYSDWVGHYAEWAPFVGVLPLFFSIFSDWKEKHVKFFGAAALISVVFALNTPLLTLLSLSHIPVLSSSYPTRIIILASFSLASLAGFGFSQLFEKNLDRRKMVISAISFTIVFLLCAVLGYILLPREKITIAFRNMVYPGIYLMAGIVLCGVLLFVKSFSIKRICLIICILLSAVQSLLFARQWIPFTPAKKIYTPLPLLSAMKNQVGTGRMYGSLSNAVYDYYRIPSIEGYDPIYSQKYSDFIRASDPLKNFGLVRSEVTIDPHSAYVDRLFNLLGVTILYQPKSHDFQSWAYPVWEKGSMWKSVYEDSAVRLYKNTQAMNLATLFCSYKVTPDTKQFISTFYTPDFPYRSTLLLSTQPKETFGSYCTDVQGTVRVVDVAADHIKLAVTTENPALMFISENNFSSWSATVNNQAVTIYPADLAFMAVEVPKGSSTVVLSVRLF